MENYAAFLQLFVFLLSSFSCEKKCSTQFSDLFIRWLANSITPSFSVPKLVTSQINFSISSPISPSKWLTAEIHVRFTKIRVGSSLRRDFLQPILRFSQSLHGTFNLNFLSHQKVFSSVWEFSSNLV